MEKDVLADVGAVFQMRFYPSLSGSGLFLMICNGQLVTYFACNDFSSSALDSF